MRYIPTWLDDRTTNTILVILRAEDLSARWSGGGGIEIKECPRDSLVSAIKNILRKPRPTPEQLANGLPDTIIEKHDYLLPKEIRDIGYGAKFFDVDGAYKWMKALPL